MVLFNRVKSCSVEELADGILEVKSIFIDSHHEICLNLHVDRDMVIRTAKADMIRVPQKYCREVEGQETNLVGVKAGPGAIKAIKNAIGHSHGCTHMADLALDAIKSLIQANFKLQHREMTQEERIVLNYNRLANTCHQWTKIGEEMQITLSEVGK